VTSELICSVINILSLAESFFSQHNKSSLESLIIDHIILLGRNFLGELLMARTNFEKQVAYIIAMIKINESHTAHERISKHLGHDSFNAEEVFEALYPLLGKGRSMGEFKSSIKGQIAGVKNAIEGTKSWTQGGLESLTPIYDSDLDTLEHQFKSIVELL